MKLNPDKKTRLIDAKPATLHPLPLEIAAKQHPIKQPTLNVSSLVISKRHARPTLKNGKSSINSIQRRDDNLTAEYDWNCSRRCCCALAWAGRRF